MKMMKQFKIYLILMCGALLISQNIYAATLDDVVKAINDLRTTIASEIKNAKDSINAWLNELNPSQPYATLGNAQEKNAVKQATNSTTDFATIAVKKSLAAKNNSETVLLGSMPATGTYFVPTAGFNITGNTKAQKAQLEAIEAGDNSLSINTLLAPPVYENPKFSWDQKLLDEYREQMRKNNYEQAENYLIQYNNNLLNNPAYNYIQLAGGLYQPAISPDITTGMNSISDSQKKLNVQSSPEYQEYQATVRAYIAAQSAGATNLYQMLVKRIPQTDLGKVAGMNKNDVSQLELEQYLATRRDQNPQWYDQMAKATPVTLQRETLFVLAEIRDQLFQLQQQNERMLATLSVMQLQSLQMNKANLQLLEERVKTKIRNEGGTVPGSAGVNGATGTQIPGIGIPGQ